MSISRERVTARMLVVSLGSQQKSQFHATHKLKSVDFRSKEVKMLISC